MTARMWILIAVTGVISICMLCELARGLRER